MSTPPGLHFEYDVPLAPRTTLEVGGSAASFLRLASLEDTQIFAGWLSGLPLEQRPALFVLGGGSNVLVSDRGFSGLAIQAADTSFEVLSEKGKLVRVRVGAGWIWDEFVAETIRRGWAGIECLSGIPGSVGAAPVQNIGAYGQEVSETIVAVWGYDLQTLEPFHFFAPECGFSYRDSRFKQAGTGRYIITSVEFQLEIGAKPTLRYGELKDRYDERKIETLDQLRALVLDVRRSKSMVYCKDDPNHRSAGSFFTNPIVTQDRMQTIVGSTGMPCYAVGDGRHKLSAAWLIEHSGLGKGFVPHVASRVGLSTNHVLALVNKGGGSAKELVELSALVIERVASRFGITLVPEPVFVGF